MRIGPPSVRARLTLWYAGALALIVCIFSAGILLFVEARLYAALDTQLGREIATIDRVYRLTTRRELGSLARPLPGSSPEFWPADWRTYGGSDAYGWGATTANLLIRHLFGFKESRVTDGWIAELTPAFPTPLLIAGQRYGMRGLNYRGLSVLPY